MIIPIKCYTCGCVLANKYRHYLKRLDELNNTNAKTNKPNNNFYVHNNTDTESAINIACKEMQLKRCCKQIIMTHVDIE